MLILRPLFAAVIFLWASVFTAHASEEPSRLIGEALILYDEAETLSGGARTEKLREVDTLLSRIENDYPDSIHAEFISDGRKVGSIDVSALRQELAERPQPVDGAERIAAEIEAAHRRLAGARDLKERLSFSKDIAELLFEYGKVAHLTSLATQSPYVDDLLREARVDMNTVGAGLVAGVYVDVVIERPLAEALADYMPENIAASVASTVAAMAEAVVTGGAVLPGYVFDQAALIAEASLSLRESNSELVAQVYSGTLDTVQALVRGALSEDLAMEQFDMTVEIARDYVGTLSYPSSRDAANRMWIIAQLARLKVQEGPRIGPAREPGELLATRLRVLEMDAGATLPGVLPRNEYQALADDVARAFGLRSWPETWQDATRTRFLGMSSDEARRQAERNAAAAEATGSRQESAAPAAPPAPYWQPAPVRTPPIVTGGTSDRFTVHPDNRVTWNGIEALPPVASVNPTNATGHVSPDGTAAVVFQTFEPGAAGWRERMSVVFADPARPGIVLSPEDVFRFGRGSLWSADGAFLASTYDFDEFENDLMIMNLAARQYYRIRSDRPPEQVSSVRLGSLRTLDDGTHAVEFSHLACPARDPNCGMATIEDAGTTEVRFRLPDVPDAPTPDTSAEGANSLTGTWRGTTTAGGRTFDYRWQIDQSGETVTGVIELKSPSATDWSRYRFDGRFADGVLTYRGTSWITSQNGNFCIATGSLNLSQSGDRLSLDGRWGGNPVPGGCPSSSGGGVRISKVLEEAAEREPARAREEGQNQRAGAASNAAPLGTMWVQVASRRDLGEARSVALSVGSGARIFRASNGWYAITATLLSEPEYSGGIDDLIAGNGWPSDSIVTRGSGFLEEIPVRDGEILVPAFTETSATRATAVVVRSWRDGVPRYEDVGMVEAGQAVTVFGGPDERGDCLLSANESVFITCADLAAFGDESTPGAAPEADFSVVVLDRPVSWSEARRMAGEMGGRLATLETPERQALVWEVVRQRPDSWVRNSSGYLIGPWLGGFQVPGSPEPAGGWQWVSGAPFAYENWTRDASAGGRQPNDTSGIEDALVFMSYGAMAPAWNDYPGSPSGRGWQAFIRSFVLERSVPVHHQSSRSTAADSGEKPEAGSTLDLGDTNSASVLSGFGENMDTFASWFQSFRGQPDLVGPASDAMEVGTEFAHAGEQFANAAPHVITAMDNGFDLIWGGPKVVTKGEFNLLRNSVQRELAAEHGANPWAGFGLNQRQFDRIMVEELERRNLKNW